MPLSINIELTDNCNSRCSYCEYHKNRKLPHGYPKGFMEESTFNSFIKSLKNDFKSPLIYGEYIENFVEVRFSGNGEPLLHPGFLNFFRQVLSLDFVSKIIITSNGTLMTKDIGKEIIKMTQSNDKLVELSVSVDANSQEVYEKVKNLKCFDKLDRVLNFLVDFKLNERVENFKMIFQFIVLEENIHESVAFEKKWEKRFQGKGKNLDVSFEYPHYDTRSYCWFRMKNDTKDEFHDEVMKNYGINSPQDEVNRSEVSDNFFKKYFLKVNKKYQEERITSTYSRICRLPWDSINIWWDGTINPCCIDRHNHLALGNIRDNTLLELFDSAKCHKLRMSHIDGNLEEFSFCKNCSAPYKEWKFPNALIKKYLGEHFKDNPKMKDFFLQKLSAKEVR